jgi:hypothetical protein
MCYNPRLISKSGFAGEFPQVRPRQLAQTNETVIRAAPGLDSLD